ncbi:MAG: ribosome silencing factor [Deltaproteobacteria bacterium]|nr:ribosome silencing factor [Deltaproteobacteria bacterium]
MSENTSRPVLDAAVEGATDLKAEDIVALDMRALTAFADTFLIATATSDRRARAITDSIVKAVAGIGRKPAGIEGYQEGRWVLIDLDELIVHVFLEDVRAEYDLERLWSDAPSIDIAVDSNRAAVQ